MLSFTDNGQTPAVWDAKGNGTSYGYDNLNRLVTTTTPKAAYWEVDHSYGYDLIGNLVSAGDSNGQL